MSRTYKHSHDSHIPENILKRLSNSDYKRQRAHKERMRLRNELADLERYEDDLDHEFVKWDKKHSKHINYYWF